MKYEHKARRLAGIHPSLMDIAFVLVFQFLILSTLAKTTQQEAEERTLPPLDLAEMGDQAASAGMTEAGSVTISVQAGPVYFLDDREVTLSELSANLKQALPPAVEIRGDVGVRYGAITEILKICSEFGIRNVALTYKSRK